MSNTDYSELDKFLADYHVNSLATIEAERKSDLSQLKQLDILLAGQEQRINVWFKQLIDNKAISKLDMLSHHPNPIIADQARDALTEINTADPVEKPDIRSTGLAAIKRTAV